ncbi:MAG: archaellin/type IV pilin N-terminal domain-containing protein [Halobacteriota archaeon]
MNLTLNDDRRGQVGIGTLIVFIAMVLVAAIAAGVLVNTAGLLQETAEETGQESQEQVTNRIQIVNTYAVTAASGTASVDNVNFTVMPSPGAEPIDLDTATIEVITDDGAEQSQLDSASFVDVNGVGSDHILDEKGDRANLQIQISNLGGASLSALEPGDEATVRLISPSGAATVMKIKVPTTAQNSEILRF